HTVIDTLSLHDALPISRLGRRHAAAALAVERVLEADGVNADLGRRKALEDALRVVGAVVVPDPRVIATHDEVSATVVLAHQRMEHGLSRAGVPQDRKSTRLNSSHLGISYAVFCLKKKM